MKSVYFVLIELVISTFFFSGCRQILEDGEPPDSIIQPPIEATKLIVNKPTFGTIYSPGDSLRIEWVAPTIKEIDIQLYRKSDYKFTLIENLENNGKFNWKIPNNISPSNHYLIKIISHNNTKIYEFSGQFGIE
ncbi:MAG: GPI anchored serine-threonine rich family protein [Ignavibacteriaceae bacterium]|nr:GPI anchored serine-threonine rich family protein [Ignavibacteriaceae bacterium]